MVFYHAVRELMFLLNTPQLQEQALQLVQAQQINNQHSHLWWALISGSNQILILPLTETALGREVRDPWFHGIWSWPQPRWGQLPEDSHFSYLLFSLQSWTVTAHQVMLQGCHDYICTMTSEGALLSPGGKLAGWKQHPSKSLLMQPDPRKGECRDGYNKVTLSLRRPCAQAGTPCPQHGLLAWAQRPPEQLHQPSWRGRMFLEWELRNSSLLPPRYLDMPNK